MKISKSLNGDQLKYIVRNNKAVVFRADSLEEAEKYVKNYGEEDEKSVEILDRDVPSKGEEKPKKKKKSFLKGLVD